MANNKHVRRDDTKILLIIVAIFLLVAWLCSPPGNKFLQICFWGNNTKMFVAKMLNSSEASEYLFYRNNAVYLAKMYPDDKRKALKEINKAISILPNYASDETLQSLYKDRAYIEMYYGEYVPALNDFLRSGKLTISDYLPVALLFKENGDYKRALSYCNAILNIDMLAYAGYACLSDIYDAAGRPEISVKVWDVAIDRKQTNPRFYADRAKYREKVGDKNGAKEDMEKAREYSPTMNFEQSIIQDTLHPKVLPLSIKS